jgi:HlyD family secretion protein
LKQVMSMRVKRPAAVGIGIVLITALAACGRAPSTPTSAATPTPTKQIAVNTAPVKRTDIASALSYTGDVKARQALSVVSKGTGRIEKLNVDVGSSVKTGDVIAELDKEQTQLSMRQSEANLAAARTKLAQIQAGARPEQVAQAEANARAARSRVQAMEQASRPEQVAQAQANVDAARQRVQAIQTPRQENVAQAEAGVQTAQARLDAVKKGPTQEQIRAAEIGVEQAKNALFVVQTQKDGACANNGSGFACQAAQKQAQAAEEAVKQSQQNFKVMQQGPTVEQVAQAQAAVDQAQQQLELARKPASDQDVATAQNAITAAEAQLSLARQPVLASDIDALRAQAEAAEAAARLAANPYTEQDVKGAQAQVALAQAQLDLARNNLKELTVISPVDGVVSDRFLVVGSVASPTTPIVSVAANDTEIQLNVEEAQLGRIQPGTPAQIAVPAYPGQTLTGKVTVVAPTIDQRSRTGIVKIAPEGDAASKLRPGMFAQVNIEAEKKLGALVIPRTAVLPGTPPTVAVVSDGAVKKVPVQLGVQDRDQVEVVSGLKDGDQVVLDAIDLRDGDRVAVASR